jgi:hypothetical protein
VNGVFFSPEEIGDMRERVARHTWAAEGFERIHAPLALDRARLLQGIKSFPLGGERARAFLALALCSRVVDEWHREAAEKILRDIEDLPSFVGSFADASTGRNLGLNALMLSEAAQNLCMGLDFLDGLDDGLRSRVVERLLLPIAERLEATHRGGSNWQTNLNLGLLCIAVASRRREYLHALTADPTRSFAYHLAEAVHPDGFWYEQCPASYHIGTIERFLRTRWIADRNGIELGGDDVLRKMIDTVIGMALPGGVLPLIGDVGGETPPTLVRVSFLEMSYAMFQPPWVAWALARTERDNLWSVLVGRDLGASEVPEPQSRLYDSSGLCVLKNGDRHTYWEGKGSGVTVTFGPHGDWHGHAGKLGIEYRHDDRYLARDLANSHGYGLPIHRMWFMTTLAHSTVVVDGENQQFTLTHDRAELERNERGKCHAHLFRDDVAACTVSADFAYPGCHLQRSLFLTSSYLLDIMECAGQDGAEHTFDWVLHTGGLVESDLPFAHASLGYYKNGYDYIREVESHETRDAWRLDVMDCLWAADIWKTTGQNMRLAMTGEAGTTLFKGVCPTAPRDVYQPVILVRRRARKTVFIALHTAGGRDFQLECVENNENAIVCRVSSDGSGPDVLAKTQDASGRVDLAATIAWSGPGKAATPRRPDSQSG